MSVCVLMPVCVCVCVCVCVVCARARVCGVWGCWGGGGTQTYDSTVELRDCSVRAVSYYVRLYNFVVVDVGVLYLTFPPLLTISTTPFNSPDSIIHLAFQALLCLGFSHTSLNEFRLYLSMVLPPFPAALTFGVPQGSVLGPILFVLYTHPISEIVSYYSLSHHNFPDDSQLYKSGNITQLPEIIHSTQSCISDVKAWMTNNQLQLNNDKTETILIATKTVLNSDCSSP